MFEDLNPDQFLIRERDGLIVSVIDLTYSNSAGRLYSCKSLGRLKNGTFSPNKYQRIMFSSLSNGEWRILTEGEKVAIIFSVLSK
jgi:hypothetical protein